MFILIADNRPLLLSAFLGYRLPIMENLIDRQAADADAVRSRLEIYLKLFKIPIAQDRSYAFEELREQVVSAEYSEQKQP